MAWRAVASTHGFVKGQAFKRTGLVDTRRRGWIGLVRLQSEGSCREVIQRCGHAHTKRRRADECSAALAKTLNTVN